MTRIGAAATIREPQRAIRRAKRNVAIVRQILRLSAMVIGGVVVAALLAVLTLPAAVVAQTVSEFIVSAAGSESSDMSASA